MSDLFIILGNQLFDPKHLSKFKKNKIFMCEDLGLCSYEKHHKLKILQFLSSMRSYRDLLIKKGFSVDYYDCQNNFEKKYEDKLEKSIKRHKDMLGNMEKTTYSGYGKHLPVKEKLEKLEKANARVDEELLIKKNWKNENR